MSSEISKPDYESSKDFFIERDRLSKEIAKQELKKRNAILDAAFTPISSEDFYKTIFPDGSLEEKGAEEQSLPNGLLQTIDYTYDPDGKKHQRSSTHLVFDSLKEIQKYLNHDVVLMNANAYSGKRRLKKRAYTAFGMIFDLDGVGEDKAKNVIHQIENVHIIPRPTLIASSGHGLHLYYIFTQPIALYPYVKRQLDQLKAALIQIIWTGDTSEVDRDAFQNFHQAYRVVGSPTKLGKNIRVKGYSVGPKVSIEYLNSFVDEENRMTFKRPEHSLDYCKEHFPEWYERRIVRKEKPRHWIYNRGMYEKWRDDYIYRFAKEGHRYYYVCVLFANAVKCGIPFDEVYNDAKGMLKMLDGRTSIDTMPTNRFTIADIDAAARYYNDSSNMLSVEKIRKMTGIGENLKRERRNGRDQKTHLVIARATRDVVNPNWREGNGRKPKQEEVKRWRQEHPESNNKSHCAKDLGISRTTVIKWWDVE